MKRFSTSAIAMAIGLAACATVPPPNTPSGQPEYTYRNVDVECVRSRIVNNVLNRGLQIRSRTDYQLVVEAPTQNFAALALLSSRGSSTVMERATFNMVSTGPNTLRVVSSFAYIGNPGTAFENVTPVQGSAALQAEIDQNAPAAERECHAAEAAG